MSNRLEELSSQYNKYRLKQFSKLVLSSAFVLSCALVPYLVLNDNSMNEITSAPIVDKTSSKQSPTYKPEVNVQELNALANTKTEKRAIKQNKIKPKTSYFKQTTVNKEVESSTYFTDLGEDKRLEVWIEKYNQKKSYSSAIYISKEYYKDTDYKQAGIWAKRANQLNRDKEEAWLYYAKSVHSLGDYPKAKRILSIYLQHKKSIKAELLLSEWNS